MNEWHSSKLLQSINPINFCEYKNIDDIIRNNITRNTDLFQILAYQPLCAFNYLCMNNVCTVEIVTRMNFILGISVPQEIVKVIKSCCIRIGNITIQTPFIFTNDYLIKTEKIDYYYNPELIIPYSNTYCSEKILVFDVNPGCTDLFDLTKIFIVGSLVCESTYKKYNKPFFTRPVKNNSNNYSKVLVIGDGVACYKNINS